MYLGEERMNSNSEQFGQRLKTARKMAGMSLDALSKATGALITKQALSKYEKGLMKPDSNKLNGIAKALGVKVGYFYKNSTIELVGLEFRKKARLGKKERDKIESRTIDFLERYVEIEETLGIRADFSNPLDGFKIKSQTDIELAVRKLRESWNLGDGPISNLLELLEDKGIRVCEVDVSDQFDGLSGFIGNIPVIILNTRFVLDRKRFTVAHELGHILLSFSDDSPKLKEKNCHAFAGAFLLPKNVVLRELRSARHRITEWELKKLKGIYGISMWAVMARARSLGIIPDSRYKNFCIEASKAGWRTREPGRYIGKEKANRFDQLVYYAVAEDIVSMSKGAELMNVSLPHFRKKFHLVS
jgi:Zn-dependent peptidase ImmA (M78 family)